MSPGGVEVEQCLAVDQGNILKASRGRANRADVELVFPGGVGYSWRVFRDRTKERIRTTAFPPDVVVRSFTDAGAVGSSVGTELYYRVTALCLGQSGP